MSTLTKLDLNFNTLTFSIYVELEFDTIDDFYNLEKIVVHINNNSEDDPLFMISNKELFDMIHLDNSMFAIENKKVLIPLVREIDMDINNTGFVNIYANNLKNASIIYKPKKSTNCFKEKLFRVPKYFGIEIKQQEDILLTLPKSIISRELTKYLLFNVKGNKVKQIKIKTHNIEKNFSYLEMNKILPHLLFGCKKLPKNMLLLPFINYDDLGNSLLKYDNVIIEIDCDNFKSCYMTVASDNIYMEYNKQLLPKYST